MTGTTGVIIFVLIIAAMVLINRFTKINMGLLGLGASLILGIWFANMRLNDVIAMFPTKIFLQQIIVTLFFAYTLATKTWNGIVDRVVYTFRGATWAMPLIILLAGYVLAVLGAGNDPTIMILSPVAFSMAASMGFDPLLAVMAVYFANCVAGCIPYSGAGQIILGIIGISYQGADGTRMLLAGLISLAVLFTIIFVIFFVVLKGYKSKSVEIKKPEPFTAEQKKTLVIIGCVLGALLIPAVIQAIVPNSVTQWMTGKWDVLTVALLGIFAMEIFKLGNFRQAVSQNVPWGTILMVGGMALFISVSNAALGFVDTLAALMGNINSARWLPVVLLLVCCLMSYFVTAFAVIWPMFMPLIPAMAAASGASPVALVAAMICGGMCTGLSPFSGGGSLSLVGATDEVREKLIGRQFRAAVIVMCLFVLFAALGWFEVIGAIFG